MAQEPPGRPKSHLAATDGIKWHVRLLSERIFTKRYLTCWKGSNPNYSIYLWSSFLFSPQSYQGRPYLRQVVQLAAISSWVLLAWPGEISGQWRAVQGREAGQLPPLPLLALSIMADTVTRPCMSEADELGGFFSLIKGKEGKGSFCSSALRSWPP